MTQATQMISMNLVTTKPVDPDISPKSFKLGPPKMTQTKMLQVGPTSQLQQKGTQMTLQVGSPRLPQLNAPQQLQIAAPQQQLQIVAPQQQLQLSQPLRGVGLMDLPLWTTRNMTKGLTS